MLSMLIVLMLLPAAAVTIALGIVARLARIGVRIPIARWGLVGTFAPFMMVAYGLYLNWRWSRPGIQYLDFGDKGSILVETGPPAWVGCLIVSYLVLRPRARRINLRIPSANRLSISAVVATFRGK